MNILEIKDLHVSVEGKEILKGINLKLDTGKINALMGPNGSGKSTLSNALMGNPKYEITKGKIIYNGKNITKLSTDKKQIDDIQSKFNQVLENWNVDGN